MIQMKNMMKWLWFPTDGSGDEDEGSEDQDEICSSLDWLSKVSYEKVCKSYTEDKKKLEIDHQYNWVDGETVHPNKIEDNILLSDSQKKKIIESTQVQLFETFFSFEMKNYIVCESYVEKARSGEANRLVNS